jgi:YHS domain-containing protein
MREHGVFFGGRVYLFSSEASLEKFSRNPEAYANQALEALRTSEYPGGTLR